MQHRLPVQNDANALVRCQLRQLESESGMHPNLRVEPTQLLRQRLRVQGSHVHATGGNPGTAARGQPKKLAGRRGEANDVLIRSEASAHPDTARPALQLPLLAVHHAALRSGEERAVVAAERRIAVAKRAGAAVRIDATRQETMPKALSSVADGADHEQSEQNGEQNVGGGTAHRVVVESRVRRRIAREREENRLAALAHLESNHSNTTNMMRGKRRRWSVERQTHRRGRIAAETEHVRTRASSQRLRVVEVLHRHGRKGR